MKDIVKPSPCEWTLIQEIRTILKSAICSLVIGSVSYLFIFNVFK